MTHRSVVEQARRLSIAAATGLAALPGCRSLAGFERTLLQPGCVYRAGGDDLLLSGDVLTPDGVVRAQALYLARGRIEEMGDRAALAARHAGAAALTCTGTVVSPGFVNAHEHLAYSHAFPPPRLAPVYAHRDEWRDGAGDGRPRLDDPQRRTDAQTLAWVELRHLLAGETTVAGGGHVPGLVRNVDRAAADVLSFTADVNTSPFGSATDRFAGLACPSTGPLPEPVAADWVPDEAPFVAHVGEGTTCVAALEVEAFLRDAEAHPRRTYTIVQGLGVQRAQHARLRDRRVAVVWSPRSNLALYGSTLDAAALLDDGVAVALGTDWSPTGSFTMLDELHCAAAHARARGSRPLAGLELWRMATAGGADALGLGDVLGTLAPGRRADLVVLRDRDRRGVDAVARSTADDVVAVLVDGVVRVADRRHVQGDPLPGCADAWGDKLICTDWSALGFGFAELVEATRARVPPLSSVGQAPCAP